MLNLLLAVLLRVFLLTAVLMMLTQPVLAYESSDHGAVAPSASIIQSEFIQLPEGLAQAPEVQALKARYPGVKFQLVTKAQYEQIKKEQQFPEYVLQQNLNLLASHDEADKDYDRKEDRFRDHRHEDRYDDRSGNRPDPRPSDCVSPRHSGGHSSVGMHIGGGGNLNGDGALIVLAIIGVILVASLLIYTVKYIFNALTNSVDCGLWMSTSVLGASVSGDYFYGGMGGFHISTGSYSERTHLGLSGEVGFYDFTRETLSGDVYLTGSYWLVGPVIHFGSMHSEGVAFSMGLLGGRSLSNDLGSMGLFRFTGTLLAGVVTFGFNGGVLYTDIADDSGVLENTDEYNAYFAFEVGTHF